MTGEHVTEDARAERRRGPSWPQAALLIGLTILVTGLATAWLIRTYVFPERFEPVILNATEERVLDEKLQRLDVSDAATASDGPFPEPYSEAGASRTVRFSERELNALLARNTDLAERVAVDLSDGLVSAKVLLPMEEDFPVLGGRVLRIHAGVDLAFADGRPVVKLRGVSLMGVPLPNAWLGGLKNLDLVEEFGAEPGFWQSFAAGVADIRVAEGDLLLELRE
jgi:hypothetical protein